MNKLFSWPRLKAALIRAFYAFVFPMLGALVMWATQTSNLESVGFTVIGAALLSAFFYGLKKWLWPDSEF